MIWMVEETWRKLTRQYETQIEVTVFGAVRRYLNSGRSPITGVVFVRQQYFLAKVAAALDENDIQGHNRIRRWLAEGHIRVVKSDELLAQSALDEKTIGNDCPCELIYHSPFHVVFLRQNTGVVFTPSSGSIG